MDQSISVSSDQDFEYGIEKGLALILWTDIFDDENVGSLGNAPKNDRDTLASILEKCNIKVMEEGGNLTVKQVKKLIRKVKERIKKEKPDIFICVISSHGRQITNKGRNKVKHVLHRVQFRDGEMDTVKITKSFNDDECPSMKGKPRLFILEVCSSRDEVNPFIEGVDILLPKTMTESGQEDGKVIIEINGDSGHFSSIDGMLSQDVSTVPDNVGETEVESKPDCYDEGIDTENGDITEDRDGKKENGKYSKIANVFRHLRTICRICEDYDAIGYDSYMPKSMEQGTLYYAPVEYSTVTEDDDEQEEIASDLFSEGSQDDSGDLNSGRYIEITSSVCYTDCLVIFASPPEKIALCEERGWLVDGLDEAFKRLERGTTVDLMELLINASFTMATEKTVHYDEDDEEMWNWDIVEDTKCIPFIEHMLTKDIILRVKS